MVLINPPLGILSQQQGSTSVVPLPVPQPPQAPSPQRSQLPSMSADQYRDLAHDVVMSDVYNGAAQLVQQGISEFSFRIACFYSCFRANPLWDKVVTDYCIPGPAGTSDLQQLGRIMAQYRMNQPSAVQYSTDGTTWQWLSDVLGKTVANPTAWPSE